MVSTGRHLTSEEMNGWWQHFDGVVSSGMAWARPFTPFFQGEPVSVRLLAATSAGVHPDLSQLETSLVDLGEAPGKAFRPTHPYATGVRVDDTFVAPDAPVSLTDALSVRPQIAVPSVTAYGDLAPHTLAATGR
jgi:hypothetical protein